MTRREKQRRIKETLLFYASDVTIGTKENKDGTMPLKFDYTVLRNPKDADTLDNQEFIDYIGDILIEQLEKQVSEGTAVYE